MAESGQTEPSEAPRKRATGTGLVALFLSLVAIGCVGYLVYREMYRDPLASVLPTLNAMQEAQSRVAADVARQIEARIDDPELPLARKLEAQQVRLEGVQQELGRLRGLISMSDVDPRPWRIAEASHLVRLANHALSFGADLEQAAAALESARGVLSSLDDESVADVIEALGADIATLERFESVDAGAIVARLDAAQAAVVGLPIALPRFDDGSEGAVPPSEGWRSLLDRLGALFEFRVVGEETPRPLLSPAEHRYLELNVSLALGRAQLAAIRRDQPTYTRALGAVATALDEFYEREDSRVAALANEIDALAALDVVPELPVVGRALSTLGVVQPVVDTPVVVPSDAVPANVEQAEDAANEDVE